METEGIRKLFHRYADETGHLDISALSQMMIEMGRRMSTEELQMLMGVLDTDHDGRISLEDLIQGLGEWLKSSFDLADKEENERKSKAHSLYNSASSPSLPTAPPLSKTLPSSTSSPTIFAGLNEQQVRELSNAFSLYESDDSKIPLTKIGKILDTLGFPTDVPEVKNAIEKWILRSGDEDGRITLDAFLEGMANVCLAIVPQQPNPVYTASELSSASAGATPHQDVSKILMLQKQLQEAENINKRITTDFLTAQDEIVKYKKQLKNAESLKDKVKELAEEVETHKTQAEQAREVVEKQRKVNMKAQTEKSSQAGEIAEKQKEIADLRTENLLLKNKITTMSSQMQEESNKDDQILQLKNELELTKEDQSKASRQARQYKEEKDVIERRLNEVSQKLSEANESLLAYHESSTRNLEGQSSMKEGNVAFPSFPGNFPSRQEHNSSNYVSPSYGNSEAVAIATKNPENNANHGMKGSQQQFLTGSLLDELNFSQESLPSTLVGSMASNPSHFPPSASSFGSSTLEATKPTTDKEVEKVVGTATLPLQEKIQELEFKITSLQKDKEEIEQEKTTLRLELTKEREDSRHIRNVWNEEKRGKEKQEEKEREIIIKLQAEENQRKIVENYSKTQEEQNVLLKSHVDQISVEVDAAKDREGKASKKAQELQTRIDALQIKLDNKREKIATLRQELDRSQRQLNQQADLMLGRKRQKKKTYGFFESLFCCCFGDPASSGLESDGSDPLISRSISPQPRIKKRPPSRSLKNLDDRPVIPPALEIDF